MSTTTDALNTTTPAKLDLTVVRGDSFATEPIVVRYGGVRLPLTDLTGTATVRRSFDDAGAWTLSVAVSQAASGEATCGEIVVSGTSETTELLPDQGVWDLQLDGVGFRKTVLRGRFELLREATR